MATGREAVQDIAAATGTPPVAVTHTARVLKEADRDLWLRSGRGIRDAQAKVHHLVNLSIALAVNQPVDAPQWVERFRELRVEDIRRPDPQDSAKQTSEHLAGRLDQPVDMGGILIAQTLGETLDLLVMQIADGIRPDSGTLAVELVPDERTPMAKVELFLPEGRFKALFLPPHLRLPLEERTTTQGDPALPVRKTMILRVGQLWLPLFELLADLWRGPDRRAPQLPLSASGEASGSADPENENAAPGRAASRDQARKNEPRTNTANREASGGREKSQSPSRGHGTSPLDEGAGAHARRKDSASASAA